MLKCINEGCKYYDDGYEDNCVFNTGDVEKCNAVELAPEKPDAFQEKRDKRNDVYHEGYLNIGEGEL